MAAAFMDILWQKVYDFIWVLGILISGILFAAGGKVSIWLLGELVFYVLVQECLMSKVYGKADSHCFVTCAFINAALGIGLEANVIIMTVSFVMLIAVQVFKKNVGKNGKLKHKVAMIPYIVSAYWITASFV